MRTPGCRCTSRRASRRATTTQGQTRASPWVAAASPDEPLAKLAALKMDVSLEAMSKMVGEHEHNKYTML